MGLIGWLFGLFSRNMDDLVQTNLRIMSSFERGGLFDALGNPKHNEQWSSTTIQFYYRKKTGEIVYFVPRDECVSHKQFQQDQSLTYSSFDIFTNARMYNIFNRYLPGYGFAGKVLEAAVREFNKGVRYDQEIRIMQEKIKQRDSPS